MSETLGASITPTRPSLHDTIERQARTSQNVGERPIWTGYAKVKDYPRSTGGNRTSDQVRTDADTGAFYVWLVKQRRPQAIVEFGTAFGVSGMYWLAGLEQNGGGHLYTFEPNGNWAEIADQNLKAVSNKYTLTLETFESSASRVLGEQKADMAFVDAIHTSEFVYAQYEVLRRHMARKSVILFDDINFSDDMRSCWQDIAKRPEIAASATIGQRIGMIELR